MNKLLLFAACCLPLRHLSLTSGFGYRVHPVTGKYSFHAGIDLRARSDTVFAVFAGNVKFVGFNTLLGVFVDLQHSTFESSYGHLSQIFVLQGDTVNAGDAIGITGSIGRVTGEHLHFCIWYGHQYINPLKFLLAVINHLIKNKEN